MRQCDRLLLLLLLLVAAPAWAFNGHRVTEGPLTLLIEPVGKVTECDKPVDVIVKLKSTSVAPLAVRVEMKNLVDDCRAAGPVSKEVKIAANGESQTEFQFVVGKGCYSAHYPLHVYATFTHEQRSVTAHAVDVFETALPPKPVTTGGGSAVVVVPQRGAVSLAATKSHRLVWQFFKEPEQAMPVGWQGSVSDSAASLGFSPVDRGELKPAIQMHPPYRPRKGTIFAEYRVRMPANGPIRLTFANAIRDTGSKEPPSDGVTFRVWINGDKCFDRHTDSKKWLAGDVDLAKYAGQEVTLRLESHPGPKLDTTCDSSFWGEPILAAGTPPPQLTTADKQRLADAARQAVSQGKPAKDVETFSLGADCRAAIAWGPTGIADAALAFGAGQRTVVFQGMRVAIGGQLLGPWPSALVIERLTVERPAPGRLRLTHHVRRDTQEFPVVAEAWADRDGLRLKISSPERITDLSPGPADRTAQRAYYGHAYCLAEPKSVRAYAGGHNLAASHVGFDFAGGVSLLLACDSPVDSLEINAEQRLYALHAHPDTQFTFVPGVRGALDCAVRYRPLYDKQRSPGVAAKAGRFVFDYWGKTYAENTALLRRAFDYGLTDSLVVMHVWQRWGYDYRLPDIFPPDPKLGTLADMQELARLCKQHGVRFAPHDNYIDFYPDADGFTYDHITFSESGLPRKAWINTGRDAQSYQFRPDHIRPFVQRNLDLVRKEIPTTSYFVDVFASANSFDFYDRQGQFHSKLETRRHWGEAFKLIRETLGANAPTISEAGSDHLIGYLDGSDCQLIQLAPKGRQFCNPAQCGDWTCVPWFDAVNHTRFSLHGVGYSSRYQGPRCRALHGIESDDYLSAEILTGHALMVDLNAAVRGAVRKYWLAQDLIRSLAEDDIAGVEFAEGNPRHVTVSWQSGTKVYVNRDAQDWSVAGRTLPEFGFFAKNAKGDLQAGVERVDGAVVERSRTKTGFYVSARGYDPDAALRIRPSVKKAEYVGDRRIKLQLAFDAEQPAPTDLTPVIQFTQPQVSRLVLIGFKGSVKTAKPASQWKGTAPAQVEATIPDTCPAGEYEILVGLIDPKSKPPRRYRMLGHEDPQKQFLVGKLIVEGKKDRVTGVRLEPEARPIEPAALVPLNAKAINFGPVRTLGALRCQVQGDKMLVTPLPESPAFAVELDLGRILTRPASVEAVEVVDPQGKALGKVEHQVRDRRLTFSTRPQDFAYQVRLSKKGE